MHSTDEPWCVLLASREGARPLEVTPHQRNAARQQHLMVRRDPVEETLQRAASVAIATCIGAVVARSESLAPPFRALADTHVFVQPTHRGTAFEVLLALLRLESRVSPTAPIVFLPADHVVSSEDIMARALRNLVDWIKEEPQPVFLLGAIPEGPHDELGYIIPWHDALQLPTGVYAFVERPDMHEARRLINAGGLWNTFIFGGTLGSIMQLFRPRFDPDIAALRSALRTDDAGGSRDAAALTAVYENLPSVDFSRDLLSNQADSLSVLRLPRCGWWPLKSPGGDRRYAYQDSAQNPAADDTDEFLQRRSDRYW